jgi:peptidoglycan/LPS O-acetylase OafA/YrhL
MNSVTMQSVPKISRQNNFDFLRILFATLVFIHHLCLLTSSKAFDPLFQFVYPFSSQSVPGFFIVSGFLIFMSYENSKTLKAYIEKRVRRIVPAYFFVIIFTASIGVFLTSLSWYQYITNPALFKYLLANLTLLNFLYPSLPGVFDKNPFNSGVNGSLWTIKVEVMFYIVVPLIAILLRKFDKLLVILIIYVLSFIYKEGMSLLAYQTGHKFFIELGWQLPGQLSFFMSGCLIYYYLEIFRDKYKYFLIPSTTIMIINGFTQSKFLPINFLVPISLATIVISIALFTPPLKIFSKYGDFSYGAYIYHYPIIQVFISLGIFQINNYLAFLLVVILLILSSYCSWHWLEKPFLEVNRVITK